MKVREILEGRRSVVVIDVADTIHSAIRKLNAHRIGALVVTNASGGIEGILSERDILRECGACCDRESDVDGVSLGAVGPARVRDVMTRDVITAAPEDELTSVMSTMTENRIRHLPILENGALAGIISIGDAVKACVEIAEAETQVLKEYIQGTSY